MKKVYDVKFKDVTGRVSTIKTFDNLYEANNFVKGDKKRVYNIIERIM